VRREGIRARRKRGNKRGRKERLLGKKEIKKREKGGEIPEPC
jgi:hypothetical protein